MYISCLSSLFESFFASDSLRNKFVKIYRPSRSSLDHQGSRDTIDRCVGSTRDGAHGITKWLYTMYVKYSGRERAAAMPWPRAEKALHLEGFGWRRRLAADFASDTPRTVASSSFPFTAVAYVTPGPHRSEGLVFRNGDKEPTKLVQEPLLPRPKIVNISHSSIDGFVVKVSSCFYALAINFSKIYVANEI